MEITHEHFLTQRDPQFGRSNPERMDMPFWELMVKGKYWAWWAREQFDAPPVREHEPIWCFDRYGMTKTKLTDGRTIHIGGEHEDWYDEDFYIYNDVIVIEPDKKISIFGYPKEVFPPTDFHTSTLVGDKILVIGGLSYLGDREVGKTRVYWLNCGNYRMAAFDTVGQNPGWIFEHKAELDRDGKTVTIRGGKLFLGENETKSFKRNRSVYALDIIEGTWRKVK